MIRNCGFSGLYVDANAVAPSTALKIHSLFRQQYVDGGIIGPPATTRGTTRLYLSGVQSGEVAQWFLKGPLEAIDLGANVNAASALKMAYAAYTKGSSALLLAVNTLAEKSGVRNHLLAEWAISQPGLATRSEKAALGTSRKAWRFVGEMQEIAKTFAEQSLPDDFHLGAAEIYRRMDSLKNSPPSDIYQVMASLGADGDKQQHN
ncbi:MAG: DUF1932 domain-containing protein [Gammaproteobacteria bacterium]|nr:DUF1932 domain-containing protein [Gammaproteobacteria bacterium]